PLPKGERVFKFPLPFGERVRVRGHQAALIPPTHTKMLFASQSRLQINVDCIFLREVTKHNVAN
ncbi:hypothetical protein SG79_03830, partial [Enterobacter hormaechei subsp. xiangfangensis]